MFAATDKSIFALDKRAACRVQGAGCGYSVELSQNQAWAWAWACAYAALCGLWTVLAVKDKVSGIMLVGTLKAETSTPRRRQMQMLWQESAAAFPACKVCPLIWLSARIEKPTRYVGGRSALVPVVLHTMPVSYRLPQGLI